MKKIVLILFLLLSFGIADSVLLLDKGWQLIGSTSKIDDLTLFKSQNVEQVWHFDAQTQKWKGYSPDGDIQKKITDKGYEKINSLESWHGFWVKSKQEWALTFATDEADADDNITLKKGWNLVSLPVNTVVSPHIFDGKTVWKYTQNNQWKIFEKDTSEDFPIISHVTNSNGIWVKSDKDQIISTATNSAKLHNFSTIDEVKAYIKDMVLTSKRPICGYYPMDMMLKGGVDDISFGGGAVEKNMAPALADNASGTNVQVKGVDEADIVKHDGKYIFYVSQDSKSFANSTINITTFENITNNHLNPITTINVDGFTESMYLVKDRLVVLSRYGLQNYKAYKKDGTVDDDYRNIPSSLVDVFDVSDIANIHKLSTYKINGIINDSRVIDNKLFLVTNFSPYIEYSYPHKIYVDVPECKEFFQPRDEDEPSVEITTNNVSRDYYDDYKRYAKCYGVDKDSDGRYFRVDYDRPEIKNEYLIPLIQKDAEEQKVLIAPETFFAPSKKDQDATITTLSKIDIDNVTLEKTSSILGYVNTIYASKNALYFVSNKYPMFLNFDRYKERSIIYKIAFDENLSYKASGFVNGRVLNQFSLDEYKNILRIATTEGNSWQNQTVNSIYTFENLNDVLFIKGVLSGLGKEGETIQSVRFMGDKGYVVTFRQMDPFYTIDLTDSSNPKKAGELKIDGFSSYLHPIDQDHILGIGRDATPDGQVVGLKMELFDVSDFKNPISVDSHTFGSQYSYSEIGQNHKALAYRDSDKLLGFAYTSGDYWQSRMNELGVFKIDGNSIKAYKSIKSPDINRNYVGLERGLIFDFANKTYVAYFADGKIAYSLLDDLKE